MWVVLFCVFVMFFVVVNSTDRRKRKSEKERKRALSSKYQTEGYSSLFSSHVTFLK